MLYYKMVELLGWLTAAFVGLSILTYIVKWYNKHYAAKLKEALPAAAGFIKQLTPLIIKNHRYLGMLAAAVMVLHMTLNITRGLISVTGLIAAGLLVLTALLGAFGAYVIKKRGKWLWVHRTTVVLMIFAIASHILIG